MTTSGYVHTALAVVALILGALVVMTPKGTRGHRALGQLYLAVLLGVNITSLLIYRLFGAFGPFHVAAVVSLTTLVAGVAPVVLRRPRRSWMHYHAHFMSWSYVGLLAAAAAEAVVRLPFVRVYAPSFTLSVLAATFGVIVMGAWVIARTVPGIVRRLGGTPPAEPHDPPVPVIPGGRHE